jgi:hypothetical protein
LSEDNDFIKPLIEARKLLVTRRRSLAVTLVKDPENNREFVGVQNAVAAVEAAIEHERKLGVSTRMRRKVP